MSSDDSGSGDGFFRGLLAGAIVAVLLLVTIAPLREAIIPGAQPAERSDEALELIEEAYFRETDPDQLQDASIEGMVRRLRRENDDRFSHYFDSEAYRRFESATSGEFSGVGMTVSEVKKGLRVAMVFEGTPAEEAGIEVGDLIVAVEGESLAGVSSTEASNQIKGPPGSEVELTVKTPGEKGSEDLTLERAKVRIPAVTAEMLEENGRKIGYASLATFSRGAHGELRAEVEDLYRRGAEALVLDLRGNGGGLLQEAVLVTSIFQDEGPIVTTEGRTRSRDTIEAEGNALDPKPLAVLTNRDTASSAEIVAAALQQNDLATVVGTRTFGKGTFQEVFELDGAAALDLTVGEYLTADGSSILGEGVKPDVRVADAPGSEQDRAVDRALRILVAETGGS